MAGALLAVEKPDDAGTVRLDPVEAACLDALRTGVGVKRRVAAAAGRGLAATSTALQRLADRGLAAATPGRRASMVFWSPTPAGAQARILRAPPAPRPMRAGSAMEKLFLRLDRPMRATELAAALGVTPQAVRATLKRLLLLGLVKPADAGRRFTWVARADDPTPLLSTVEERVLSGFPVSAPTTERQLAARLSLPREAVRRGMDALVALDLAAPSPSCVGPAWFVLTRSGAAHVQRHASARRAPPAPLPVKSFRVRAVLDHLADNGPTRTVEIGRALGVERHAMNALMQYLKRRGLAEKTGVDLNAPHALTKAGHRTRAEFLRRSAEPDP